jgi:D-beta-D-heptose 7-phosphate kinase/D-beta-D-heptose 1-phosphate adenosyltransferase
MCTLLKPNWNEACQLVGADPDRADRSDVARALSEQYDCDVLITLGSEGVLLYERAADAEMVIPTRPREAFDIAGAGDTTLAVIALTLAAAGSLLEAAVLANLAGGIVVEKSGTAYVTPEELLAELRHPQTREIIEQVREDVRRAVA